MQKVRFLQDFGFYKKDSFRVIMIEDQDAYHIQRDLHSDKTQAFYKNNNGKLFQVVERS